MSQISQVLAAAALWLVAGVAQAQFSATVTGATEYDFRGISQSARDPAIQGSLDYALSNGLSFSVWASNVDFRNDASAEVDYIAAFSHDLREGLAFTSGLVFYAYPGSDDVNDYVEVYVGLDTEKWSFKQWYSDNFYRLDQGNAWYFEGNGTYPMPHDFSLLLHVGYSWGEYWRDGDGGGSLFDFSVGVGYTIHNFELALKVTGTDASGEQKVRTDLNNNEPRLMFTIATTFPWGGEE